MGASAVKAGFLSRREFLQVSGQAGLGALALTARMPNPLGETSANPRRAGRKGAIR